MGSNVRYAGCPGEASPGGGFYRPRNVRASALYQCAHRHAEQLRSEGRLQRLVEERVIERFLECGDPHCGFARIYCPSCRHGYLLAFSCKARYFCPSCHQKRVLAYGDWVEQNVLARVPHRQYVFTMPRLLRPVFSRRRGLLGALCHIVERLLKAACCCAGVEGRPGLILFVQTFGDLVTFNPHIHVLAADGVFRPDGVFVALPALPAKLLEQGFRSEVLKLLVAEGAIGERLCASMLAWRHSGFSVHNSVRVRAGDAAGRKKLAQYMLRAPFSLEKMTYLAETGMVVYRSQMHKSLKRNFQLMPGAQWLALLCRHIPDRFEHLVRYVGWYSTRCRGARARAAALAVPAAEDGEVVAARARSAWARLGDVVDQMFGVVLVQMLEGERRAGTVAQQPFAPGPVGAFDAHRGVEREAAAVCPATHLVTSALLEQAAADAGAQHTPAHVGLHLEHSGRSQRGGCMKHHARRRVRGVGRREDRIEDAAVKVQMRVQRRAEAVDEDHRAQAGCAGAAGTMLAQAALDGAQQDAHDHALQRGIVVQEIAQPLGHGQNPLPQRQRRQHVIAQRRGGRDHAPGVARRAYGPALAVFHATPRD